MVRHPTRTLAISILLAVSTAALADASVTGKPKVSFHAEGSPGALDIEGTTTDLRVLDDDTTLTFTVPLDSVDTGIELRDHHMKSEYAQTALYPDATLTLTRSAIVGRSSSMRRIVSADRRHAPSQSGAGSVVMRGLSYGRACRADLRPA